MPPKKKKTKGKSRGAAKSKKKEELGNDSSAGSDVTSQMQQLQINSSNNDLEDEDALLEAAMNLASAERKDLEAAATKNEEENEAERCNHGFVPWPRRHLCEGFVRSFTREFTPSSKTNSVAFGEEYQKALKSTKNGVEVVTNPVMLQMVISHFLAEGTNVLLGGEIDLARQPALYATVCEHMRAMISGSPNFLRNHGKIEELLSETCDEHTIVSFFKKRIPCKCLDKIRKEVKSIVKMSICNNTDCPLPDRKAERSKLLECQRCRAVFYCSIECQKAAWRTHKGYCQVIGSCTKALADEATSKHDS